ncbi:hypothetical protein NMY22_g17160 [Coprinellus aureogranulatus]|nr:hypothetical protein NMY22_g17160 [Coprinellus aureogranulatus]
MCGFRKNIVRPPPQLPISIYNSQWGPASTQSPPHPSPQNHRAFRLRRPPNLAKLSDLTKPPHLTSLPTHSRLHRGLNLTHFASSAHLACPFDEYQDLELGRLPDRRHLFPSVLLRHRHSPDLPTPPVDARSTHHPPRMS